MEKLFITLLESEHWDTPNVGTIAGVTSEELLQKATQAIESHFDGKVTSIRIQDNLDLLAVRNNPPLAMYVTIEGIDYEINLEAQQTWIY